MNRRVAVILLVIVAVALAVGLYALPRMQAKSNAQRLVSAYNVALSQALATANTAPVGQYVDDRELGRLESYFVELRGRGVIMEAELLSIEFGEIASAEPTTTVRTHERWRYVERSTANGQRLTKPVEEDQRLEYTLLKRDGRMTVHLSRLLDDGSANGKQ